MALPPQFDLFLSYNTQDQNDVLELRRKLELRGIHTFLDREGLVAGLPWPPALEKALLSSAMRSSTSAIRTSGVRSRRRAHRTRRSSEHGTRT